MARVFVSQLETARERWRQAFPEADVIASLSAAIISDDLAVSSVWLDLTFSRGPERQQFVTSAVALGVPVIGMVGVPGESDAFELLKLGIQGYCHVEAAPEQLREIALVVEHGGLWMPPDLMQRFLAVSTRVLPVAAPAPPQLNDLTPRELMVAEQVARGASNREISETLNITERTVKAHLTAIFEKLGLRDRVQLALAMNNIPTYSTVN
jgi:two-component system nitrate/nitrite response regulator NarL